MRKLGWSLLGAAFLCAMLSLWFGRENVFILAAFGLSLVLGSVLLLTSFGQRLYRGEVRLRPVDAAKMAVILFVLMMILRLLLASFVFPESDRTLTEHIWASAIFAIFFSLYQTAYRKPA